ncbi:hypothetical protein KN815_34775 [Streptomyces sp. 4503]|uniref:Uncharacterized protein n=1 Tax=Streptomyces niphimycinicus TaxID=2842201 RepID=A0ABS6CQ01_9ACTN|nr:hypothetical protein [Streptomyces niphimycinicus]MBU3869033.1 hypothetical protein [Streptomyces niphimycinicus]
MKDVTTATGGTVPGAAIEQLLFTQDCRGGVRGLADTTICEKAAYAYELAYRLSGGGDLHRDAHSAGVSNLLGHVAPGIVAFALHHLGALLPDLTDEQWARIDAAAVSLSLRVCEDLTGANGGTGTDDDGVTEDR